MLPIGDSKAQAELLIAQGAHPRAIRERMGHSTITVTLDNYGHLFPRLDDALDGVYQVSSIGASTAVDSRGIVRWSRWLRGIAFH